MFPASSVFWVVVVPDIDGVDLADVFTWRALVMQSVPPVLQGPTHSRSTLVPAGSITGTAGRRPGGGCHGCGNCSCCCRECCCREPQRRIGREGRLSLFVVASGQSC